MHKQIVNELRLSFVIRSQGPILIKSGREAGADPTLLDMNFVRLHHGQLGETVYLPGSSLKGTLRSYCEKIARTVVPGDYHFCCNPFDEKRSCGMRVQEENKRRERAGEPVLTSAEVYQRLCAICKLFGHTVMASHLQISDAYPPQPINDPASGTGQRDGVAIDRISGAVAVGPFNLEVVTRGEFSGHLYLKNFQLWQVGLLALALRDLKEGRVPIGFGKSRGLGRVAVDYTALEVSYPGQYGQATDKEFRRYLYGVSAFAVADKEVYRFADEGPLTLPEVRPVEDLEWGRATLRWRLSETATEAQRQETAQAIEDVFKATVPAWRDYVLAYRRA